MNTYLTVSKKVYVFNTKLKSIVVTKPKHKKQQRKGRSCMVYENKRLSSTEATHKEMSRTCVRCKKTAQYGSCFSSRKRIRSWLILSSHYQWYKEILIEIPARTSGVNHLKRCYGVICQRKEFQELKEGHLMVLFSVRGRPAYSHRKANPIRFIKKQWQGFSINNNNGVLTILILICSILIWRRQ